MKKSTKEKGIISEIKVLTKLVEKGYTVSLPYGDNARYDLIFDDGEKLNKVQVKSSKKFDGDKLVFPTCSYNNANRDKRTYENDVDYFGVYCKELDEVFLVPISDCNSSALTLRITEPKGKNNHQIKYARDYKI